MTKRPSYQWYPGDHRRDVAVQTCSYEARSLWREMLDLMHDGLPYGHLTAGGCPITEPELARIVGISRLRAKKYIHELESRQVFSRTDGGVIYSRRMVRDNELSVLRKTVGKRGGNPALRDHVRGDLVNQEPGDLVNQKLIPPLNQSAADAVCTLQSAVTATPPSSDLPSRKCNGGTGVNYKQRNGRDEKGFAMGIAANIRNARTFTRGIVGSRYHIPKDTLDALPPRAKRALDVIGGASMLANADDQRWSVILGQYATAYLGVEEVLSSP